MAATAITVQNIKAPFAAITAGLIDIVFTALTITDGDEFQVTGKEVVLLYNSGVGAVTFTVTSEPDAYGRETDITAYSMAAGDYAVLGVGLTMQSGWINSSGKILITPSSADLLAAVLRLP